jgi:hypothetical protein
LYSFADRMEVIGSSFEQSSMVEERFRPEFKDIINLTG